jgi:RNA polymerase sigma-70 factor (ECF subfamily)
MSEGHTQTSTKLRDAVAGDRQSLGWLVARLSPALVALARLRLGPALRREHDPDDLVQDAWLTVLPRLAQLPARDGRLTPVLLRFLATVILNRTNNLRKRQLRRRSLAEHGEVAAHEVQAEVTGVVTAAVRQEQRELVLAAIEQLEEGDREVLFLHGLEQHSNAVVAQLLGIRPEAASMRYVRALERLRRQLPGSVFDDLAV